MTAMRKSIVLFAALMIACAYSFADTYTHSAYRSEPTESYYLDRKLQEQKEKSDPLSVGLLTADFFTPVILLILVSSVITPILLKKLYKGPAPETAVSAAAK